MVYDYFGGAERFPRIGEDMMAAVDKADAAEFTREDILDPQGWDLLNFLMDPRTGLGRFREFRISNYQLMMQLIDDCTDDVDRGDPRRPRTSPSASSSTASTPTPRSSRSRRCATVHGNLVVLDLRDEEVIYADQPLHDLRAVPQCNISIHVLWGLQAAEHGLRDAASRSSTAARARPTSAS